MSWVGVALGTPWKTLSRIAYVALHWDTISHDLDMYRAEIRDRDEWITAIKARHREQEETLRQQTEAWAQLADRGIALVEGQTGKLEETGRLLAEIRQQFITLMGNYIDCTMLLTFKLHWESPDARLQYLNLLDGNPRAVVEAGLAAFPVEGSDASPDFPNIRATILGQVLRLTAPPG